MDLSLLPSSSSESNTQRQTGARFTVRSANSPSYSFTRRSGIRRRKTVEAVGESDKLGTYAGTNGANDVGNIRVKDQSEEKDAPGYQMTTKQNQMGPSDKTTSENGTDGGVNSVLENRGRIEWRASYLPSRSQSLDWRSEATSPVQCTRTDLSAVSTKGETDFSKQAKSLKERRSETGVNLTRTVTSLLQDRSPVNHSNLPLDRVSRVNSLPSRFRSESGPKFTENLSGSTGGQSIQERIQKLFESACEGGTFPRRFSSGDNHSPVHNRVSFIWTQKDSNASQSETLVSPEPIKPKEKSPVRQWQRPLSGTYLEESRYWEKEKMESGTKSLDRARSKNTKAAQIRQARAAGEISRTILPKPPPDETLCRSREPAASLNQEDRTERLRVQEKDKETLKEADTLTKHRSADEDVFEANSQRITLKTAERNQFPEKLSAPTSASVKNKISQFEALTQKATSQVQLPRRTLSVPAHLHTGYSGVRKSESVKEIGRQRDRWEEIKEGGEKVSEKGKKFGPERSLSVDEVGLRLDKLEAKQSDLGDKDKNVLEDSNKYSRLKKTMHIPLNEETQRRRRIFNFDEDLSRKDAASSRSYCDVFSPVSGGDETPTNIPDDSPFILPASQAENTPHLPPVFSPLVSDVSTTEENTDETDFPPLLPATSSENNMSDVFYPNVKTSSPKGKKQLLHLNAWVASLNPEYKCWNDYMDHYEDDDQSTQKDDDSNYDSDSGDSSVTITSSTSQSDRRSFSLSLSNLCNFSGVECESDNDIDAWELRGGRSASMSSDMSAFSSVSLLPTEELDQLLEDVKSLGDETLQDYNDVQVVVLHKEPGVGLGFSLAGGVDQNKPIIVHKVFPSGVAAKEGSIREGDQVLSINGTALCGNAHWEAIRVLRRAKTRDMAVVVLRKSDDSGASKTGAQKEDEQAETQQKMGQRVCVQLQKNSRDLGFSLHGGVGSSEGNRPLIIQKIFQGGPVDKVFPGDEVLEIEGNSMLTMRRLEAWTFIRGLPPGPVTVVLRRHLKHQQT